MKNVVFHVNHTKPRAAATAARLSALARELGFTVLAEGEGRPDVVLVLGGDGTMLSAVHAYPGVPLLGLNLGSLGYLAGVEEPRFDEAVRALAAGHFTISRRTALEVRVNGGAPHRALNDVVVARGVSGHTAVIALAVDDRSAARFNADGLVIATPTGSTAYSLAAGGPILLPDSASFAVTPICPHALASRPLVLPDTARLALRAPAGPAGALTVYADGATVGELGPSDALEVVKAVEGVPLVELPGYDPYEVLARKLGWNSALKVEP